MMKRLIKLVADDGENKVECSIKITTTSLSQYENKKVVEEFRDHFIDVLRNGVSYVRFYISEIKI